MSKRKSLPTRLVEELLVKSKRRCALCFDSGKTLDPQLGNIVKIKAVAGDTGDNLAYLCPTHHALFDEGKFLPKDVKKARDQLYAALEGGPCEVPHGEAPRVFIAGSANDVVATNRVRDYLGSLGLEPIDWRVGVFNIGTDAVESLVKNLFDVSYAVFLLTGDEFGGQGVFGNASAKPRANIIFELGMFIGGLGRRNVTLLINPGVDLPSDLLGLSHIVMDKNGRWAELLTRELNAVGLIPAGTGKKPRRANK